MKTDTAAAAALNPIPGLVIRPYAGLDDVPAFVRIVNAEYQADGVEERLTEEGERAWLAETSDQFDPGRDVSIAVLAAFHADGRPGGRLMRRAGYEVVRWFFDMVRPSLDDLPSDLPPLPAGLELRPATPDHYPAIWRANREAFRDHWGGSDESEAAMRRFLESPEMDPALWLIAWDGDEVAGGVINAIYAAENEALGLRRGRLANVFTRRPWRNRGLAGALIARSLVLLRDREMTSAALGVDAENATGALGLYERAGFAVHDRFVAWRKPMNMGDPK